MPLWRPGGPGARVPTCRPGPTARTRFGSRIGGRGVGEAPAGATCRSIGAGPARNPSLPDSFGPFSVSGPRRGASAASRRGAGREGNGR